MNTYQALIGLCGAVISIIVVLLLISASELGELESPINQVQDTKVKTELLSKTDNVISNLRISAMLGSVAAFALPFLAYKTS